MAAMKKKILQEIDNSASFSSSSSSSSNSYSMELVTQSAFKFRNPSASFSDTNKFLDSVFRNFKCAKELNFSRISKFTLDFPFRRELKTFSVGVLIHQALQFKVKKLKLILTNGNVNEYLCDSDVNRSFDLFRLPGYLNDNKFLTKMNLAMCSFKEIRETIKWDNLTKLRLAHTCLDQINKIVEGCPVLEVLELCECWGFKSLDFENHQTLKVFVLDGVWPKHEERFDSITISAPTVEYLAIRGQLDLRYVVLKNISGCLDAEIDFYWTSGDHGKILEDGGYSILMLQQFLQSLKDVPNLTFGTWFIETIFRKFYVRFELRKCIMLTLQAPVVPDRYQRGMLHIIESCFNPETVIIRDTRTYPLCKICTKCIHNISRSTNEISLSNSKVQRNFGFKILEFYKDAKAATSSNIGGGAAKNNHIGGLPDFIKFLIKNSRRSRLQMVVLK